MSARCAALGYQVGRLSGGRGAAHSEAVESESIMKKGRRWAWCDEAINCRHPLRTPLWGDRKTTNAYFFKKREILSYLIGSLDQESRVRWGAGAGRPCVDPPRSRHGSRAAESPPGYICQIQISRVSRGHTPITANTELERKSVGANEYILLRTKHELGEAF